MAKKKKQKPDFSKPKPVKNLDTAVDENLDANENVDSDAPVDSDADLEQKSESPENAADEIDSRRKNPNEKFFPDQIYFNLPLIVIAGRPNVGKSTLFNALTHTKRAITDPTPGVTRDPVEGTCFLAGKPVHLMDTG
ncbi:MAG: 50S ribosome-binding GTPase, partial [Treponema sp.]|nr:50S ribosome-binding GTPase [Treponema sp.]